MEEIIIAGTSGCAREVVFLIEENNKKNKQWNILGFVDNSENPDEILPYPVLGNDEWLLSIRRNINVVIAIGDPKLKKKLADKYQASKYIQFPTIVSKNAIVGDRNRIGKGVLICNGVTITTDVIIEDFVLINIGAIVCHQTVVEKYSTIAPGTNISGNVRIGQASDIGVGSKIIQNIKIGKQAIVGAGTVVIRDVEEETVVVGNPARRIR